MDLSKLCQIAWVAGALATSLASQSELRSWGLTGFTTEARQGTFLKVAAGRYLTASLRQDGQLFVHGSGGAGNLRRLLPPSGLTYTDVAVGDGFTVALLSDGSITGWGAFGEAFFGAPFVPPPPAPAGLRYTAIAAGGVAALALRSDGQVVAWGDPQLQANYLPVPSFPATPIKVQAGGDFMGALLGNGTIVAWGDNTYGQTVVPALPAGQTYVDFAAGGLFAVAIRSDGTAVGWGYDPGDGRTLPPALPSGMRYVAAFPMTFSMHALLLRSDGALVAFGNNWSGPCDVPTLPPGRQVVQAAGGFGYSVALLSDGSILGWGANGMFQAHVSVRATGVQWHQVARGQGHCVALASDGLVHAFGDNTYGQLDVPPLPSGLRYTQVTASYLDGAALRSDGVAVAWGVNCCGQNNISPPPSGIRYVQVATSDTHSLVLRSDGQVAAFGSSDFGRTTVPPLPPGLRYTQVAAGNLATVLLRSDGQIVVASTNTWLRQANVPALPTGHVYTAVAVGSSIAAGLRSDGTLGIWGSSYNPSSTLFYYAHEPVLPPGVVYVEVAAGMRFIIARRSDGTVMVTGVCGHWENEPPPLFPGTSYVEVDGYGQHAAARVGPTSTYVSFASGCAGSRPASRLIPRDTPKIGRTLAVGLLDLPHHSALVLFGFGRPPAPVSLQAYGLPGCFQHVDADAVTFWAGADHRAQFDLPIPDWPGLIGQRFYNQAVVFDAGAGNSLGAVVSAAAEAVIGDQ